MTRSSVAQVLLFVLAYAGFLVYLKPPSTAAIKQFSTNTVAARINEAPIVTRRAPPTAAPSDNQPASVAQSLPPARSETSAPLPIAEPVVSSYVPPSPVVRLQRMAEDDELAENRLAAIRQLSNLSANGDKTGAIRRSLQSAMTDADEAVAAAARTAYSDLMARTQQSEH